MNRELRKWLVAHDACKQGLDRMHALHVTDMQDAYNRASPNDLIWAVTQPGVMTQRQCVQFALFCVRQVEPMLMDERSRAVIPALEKWLNGEAVNMRAVYCVAADAAYAAATDAAYAAAYAAADAARAAADAAYAAARRDLIAALNAA